MKTIIRGRGWMAISKGGYKGGVAELTADKAHPARKSGY